MRTTRNQPTHRKACLLQFGLVMFWVSGITLDRANASKIYFNTMTVMVLKHKNIQSEEIHFQMGELKQKHRDQISKAGASKQRHQPRDK